MSPTLPSTIGGRRRRSGAGYSLVELVVATGVFALLMLSATGLFKSVLDGQRSAIAGQNMQENMRYVFEAMSKEIRLAVRRTPSDLCEATYGYPTVNRIFNETDDLASFDALYFLNKDDECVSYTVNNGQLIFSRLVGDINEDLTQPVTPAGEIEITRLEFEVADNPIGAFRTVFPQVTVTIEARVAGGAALEQRSMTMQTTIASRYYR